MQRAMQHHRCIRHDEVITVQLHMFWDPGLNHVLLLLLFMCINLIIINYMQKSPS